MKTLFSRVSFYNVYNFFDKFEESKIKGEEKDREIEMLVKNNESLKKEVEMMKRKIR